jgi:hypothetical protein
MNVEIGTCDGKTSLCITGGGIVDLVLKARSGQNVRVGLAEIAYSPNSRCNLLSLPMLADNLDASWVGNKHEMILFESNGDEFAHAPRNGQLYHFQLGKGSTSPSSSKQTSPLRNESQPRPSTGQTQCGTNTDVTVISALITCSSS